LYSGTAIKNEQIGTVNICNCEDKLMICNGLSYILTIIDIKSQRMDY